MYTTVCQVASGKLSLLVYDDLEGWDGVGGREI